MYLCFKSGEHMLDGHTYAYLAGHCDLRNSTWRFFIIFAREALFWQFRLQKCIALLTTDIKYISISEACKEALWMRIFLQELGLQQENVYALM